MTFEIIKVVVLACQVSGSYSSYGWNDQGYNYHSAKKQQMVCVDKLLTCVKAKGKPDANNMASCLQAGGY